MPLYFFGLTGLYKPEYAININKPPCLFRVPKNDSIAQFISAIARGGGMSMTNGYDLEFEFDSDIIQYIEKNSGVNPNKREPSQPGYLISLLCDEAQLPNIQSATSQITGVHLGEGQISYPHTKMYSDFTLSWMCDANMTPLKFLNSWYNYIFTGAANINGKDQDEIKLLDRKSLGGVKEERKNLINRSVRLRYPKNYLSTVRITKTEKGANAPNSRAPISYIMEECYPYSIDAVPLSYGSSQVTRVSANFYYRKHTLVYNDISGGYQG